MVSDVYSHILDEDRRNNATRFEEAFYNGNAPQPFAASAQTPIQLEPQRVMELLANAPELAAQLLQMLIGGTKVTVNNA